MLPDGGRLHLLASNPTPPLFDGAERLQRAAQPRRDPASGARYLDGAAAPRRRGPVAGAARGAGGGARQPQRRSRSTAPGSARRSPRCSRIRALQDPRPASARRRGGGDAGPAPGDAGLDTADWREDGGPGNLRVDYVLPSAELAVAAAGVFWPAPGEPLAEAAAAASAHRLVWVDLVLP